MDVVLAGERQPGGAGAVDDGVVAGVGVGEQVCVVVHRVHHRCGREGLSLCQCVVLAPGEVSGAGGGEESACGVRPRPWLLVRNAVVYDRFAGTGTLAADDARALGCLGYPARASGLVTDARLDHPTVDLPVTEACADTGDVLARYTIRRDEFAATIRLVTELAGNHSGPVAFTAPPKRNRGGSGVGIVEGWRGTIVHRIEIDDGARLTRAKIVDPSWFNWPALPVAMRDTIVPDFPLVNKSFNLSYAGNDL
ncbi:hypothetical protein CRH09_27060 [Nocardia terpenica]|uniref:NADH-quinone oxidoreductase subunit D domain-containing protein n=1 Tax=Nocardia terpenica TaxID=455432 RepID=A0A291RPP7_9NOCA|nr:hypothetical protein CRH09_27060 [Nocardia terpenica]